MKVLLIEDDPLMYRMYQRILKQEGYEVFVVDSAEKGLQELEKQIPDLILLDIMMPKMNGIEVLQQIKSNPLTKTIPVIMLTNLGVDNVINDAFQAGASGYLIKSQTTNTELVKQIETILKNK